jgi:hypothetical protein
VRSPPDVYGNIACLAFSRSRTRDHQRATLPRQTLYRQRVVDVVAVLGVNVPHRLSDDEACFAAGG